MRMFTRTQLRMADMTHTQITPTETAPRYALIRDVQEFADSIISDRFTDDELDEQAQDLIARHGLTQEELVSEVYGHLLMLARFCCCDSRKAKPPAKKKVVVARRSYSSCFSARRNQNSTDR